MVRWTPYRAVVRLIATGGHYWPLIDAEFAGRGDLLDLRLDRFLNYIYAWAFTRIGSEEDREKFIQELDMPLEGESAKRIQVSQETIDKENEAFDAFAGMLG